MSTQPPTKYFTLIRHGQALHNATGNNSLLDPCLTPLGINQCQDLNKLLNNPSSTIHNLNNNNGNNSNRNKPLSLPPPPSLLVSSPLTRTLQTTLISFSTLLKSYPRMKIIPLALLQETADIPCDTGRGIDALKEDFGGNGTLSAVELGLVEGVGDEYLLTGSGDDISTTTITTTTTTTTTDAAEQVISGIDGTEKTSRNKKEKKGVNDRIEWDLLDPRFPKKQGIYAADKKTLCERGRLARKWIWEKLYKSNNSSKSQITKDGDGFQRQQLDQEQHVVCVLHGGFIHYVTEDWTDHESHRGTGWLNTEFRTFEFLPVPDGQDLEKWSYSIVETEGSKDRRRKEGLEKPLGKTKRFEYRQTHPDVNESGNER